MIPVLVGFAIGWLLRGLYDKRGEMPDAPDTEPPPSGQAGEVAPAAAFAQGRPDADA